MKDWKTLILGIAIGAALVLAGQFIFTVPATEAGDGDVGRYLLKYETDGANRTINRVIWIDTKQGRARVYQRGNRGFSRLPNAVPTAFDK